MSESEQRSYKVTGMSCEHCVAAVTAEVKRVEGVSDVEVDLDSGMLAVRGTALDDDAVRSAVADAGYELAQSS